MEPIVLNFISRLAPFVSGVALIFLIQSMMLRNTEKELSKWMMDVYIFFSAVGIILFLIQVQEANL